MHYSLYILSAYTVYTVCSVYSPYTLYAALWEFRAKVLRKFSRKIFAALSRGQLCSWTRLFSMQTPHRRKRRQTTDNLLIGVPNFCLANLPV